MTFKALVFSDLHAGNSLPHAEVNADGSTDRLQDSCDALAWVLKTARERELMPVCLGDFFDERLVDTITQKRVAQTLVEHLLGPLYVVPGNHDASDQANRHFSPEVLSVYSTAMGKVHALGAGEISALEPNIYALPYCSPEEAREFIAKHAQPNRLLLAHLEVDGYGHGGAWTCHGGVTEELLGGWGAVLSGHFHAYQPFKTTQGAYVGALRQLKFDDGGKQQGAWAVEWDGNKLTMEFIPMAAPDFETLNGLASEWEKALEMLESPLASYIKIRLSGAPDELACVPREDIKKSLNGAGVRRVVFDDQPVYHHTKRRMEASTSTPLEDLVQRYVESPAVNIGGLDLKRLVEIGSKAITEARARERYKSSSSYAGVEEDK